MVMLFSLRLVLSVSPTAPAPWCGPASACMKENIEFACALPDILREIRRENEDSQSLTGLSFA